MIISLNCCGVNELADLRISNPAEYLWQHGVGHNRLAPMIRPSLYNIFTQATLRDDPGMGYGYAFAQFIRDNNLGQVIDTIPGGINPNSSNFIRMWVWIVDLSALRAWFQAEAERRAYVPAPPVGFITSC